MKITVKETPASCGHELNDIRNQRAAVLAAAARCERQAVALDAKIARLSRPEKTYVLELTEREAAVLGNVLGQVRNVGDPAKVCFVLHGALCDIGAYDGASRLIAPIQEWMLGQVRLIERWPEHLK